MRTHVLSALFLLSLAACGDEKSKPPPPPPSSTGGGATAASDHTGETKDLGRVTLAGHELAVTRLGDVVPGTEGAFEAALVKGPAGATLEKLNVYAWVEDTSGSQMSAPSKGTVEDGRLHFHVTPRAEAKDLKRVVVRLRGDGGIDERAALPLDGHGHEHVATPHDGIVAAFKGPDGKPAGHLELKLHDDKGDLELWIAKDAKITQPLDLPLTTVVRVDFPDLKGKTVELKVRNAEKNEDEEGTPNVRPGGTNYFIFPGDTGADAAWLMGKEFSSIVRVTFTHAGAEHVSEEFVLTPHTHADGHTHK